MKNSGEHDLRAHILAEVARLNAADGRPPGVGRFKKATGISEYQVHRYWAEWGDVLVEAGLAPNVLNLAIPEDDLIRRVADLTRTIGRPPSRRYVVHASLTQPGFPHHSTLMRRFGNQQALLEVILDWTRRNPEYDDVASIISGAVALKPPPDSFVAAAVPSRSPTPELTLSESYVPPVVACLEPLAHGDSTIIDACKAIGRDPNAEFEARVGIAFELLGLDVERLGQGYGRVADGIARCSIGGWSIIYDAKVRRDRYRLLTEDRKFREYIETHVPTIKNKGLQRCYFAIVSSQFSAADVERAHELVRLTDVKACVFLEASALAALVEERVRRPATFGMDDLERLMMHTRVLTVEDVRKQR